MQASSLGVRHRRRVYLMRHGDVRYVQDDGNRVPDAELVELTEDGRAQARAMARALREVPIDRAVASGLVRTHQTAAPILEQRDIALEQQPAFDEIRSGGRYPEPEDGGDIPAHVYATDRAADEGARWAGGERFADHERRVLDGWQALIRADDWRALLLVAHGMTNRAILGWALGCGRAGYARIEQDTACLNIIDVDVVDGAVRRTILRQLNMTPYNLPKTGLLQTSVERGYAMWQGLRQAAAD